MAISFLNLKEAVTNSLGANDASTPGAVRDKLINQARRQFYSERRWSYLFKTTTVSLTAQSGTLPSDYNKKFPPLDVYYYTGNLKFQLDKVPWGDLSMYDQSQYVYAIDMDAGTLKVNQTALTSVTLDYTYLPADRLTDGTEDSNTEPAPDISPIAMLAVAKWWLASERATGKYQLFMEGPGGYKELLDKSVTSDLSNTGVIQIYPRSRKIRTGYWGRGS